MYLFFKIVYLYIYEGFKIVLRAHTSLRVTAQKNQSVICMHNVYSRILKGKAQFLVNKTGFRIPVLDSRLTARLEAL